MRLWGLIAGGWAACAVLCVALTFHSVCADEASRMAEFRRRIQATAALGSKLLDKAALEKLWPEAATALSDDRVTQVHGSAEYWLLSRQLNEVRNTDKALIKYVYVLRDGEPPRFLADADVLSDKPPPREKLSYFSRSFENSNVERLAAALRTCSPQVEHDFVPDPDYDAHSLSAYAPILARNGSCLGILGVDMLDIEMRETIDDARRRAWLHCVFVLVAAFLAIIAVVYVFQKPWLRIAKRVSHLANRPLGDKPQSFHERLDAEMKFIENQFESPTESVQRHASNEIAKLYGGPVTAARVRHDVVPEYVHGTVPADAQLQRHAVAHCLVAGVTGLSKAPNGSTNATIQAAERLQQQFLELAKKHGTYATMTTGDSVLVIGIAQFDVVLALATEMVSAAKACATASQLPISTQIGIDTGPVVVRVTAAGGLVDAWGEALITASVLHGQAAADRILLTAAAQEHNKTVVCRVHRHGDGGRPEVYIVSTRHSQDRITQDTTNAT